MKGHNFTLVYPGDLNTLTGGYRYDKRIAEGLADQQTGAEQWQVSLLSLEGDFPFPDDVQLKRAATQLDNIPDGALVVLDGLAYSVMPELVAHHAQRLKMIALIHHPLALETGLSPEQSRHFKAKETHALQYARHVITTSELTAASLAEYDVPRHRITSILPGTDYASPATGSGTQEMNLLCVATLTQRKGHQVLFEALSKIQHLNWHLNCVGSCERDKQTYSALLEQIERLHLKDRISFAGEVSDADLEQHYLQADLFVLASYHEGYGMVLSEAIARALPIVATNSGAISTTVPESAGLLVPPGDAQSLASALQLFIENRQTRDEMKFAAKIAREQIRSWQDATKEFAHTLKQIQAED